MASMPASASPGAAAATSLNTASSAGALEEAAAIAAGYGKGRYTAYYVHSTQLPTVNTSSGSSGGHTSTEGAGGAAAALFTAGDFSVLPHPEYAGRSGKTLNKPLYLHHLKS